MKVLTVLSGLFRWGEKKGEPSDPPFLNLKQST